jgi:hypothetical protein
MAEAPRWLLLIHQIPPRPAYLRVKIGRRLARTGALPLKNTVYVLPNRERTLADFRAILQEIVRDGGDATLADARFIEGIRDRDLEDLFNRSRNFEYQAIAQAARKKEDLFRLRKRLADVVAIDFFGAPGRPAAERALAQSDRDLRPPPETRHPGPGECRRRTWVTRQGIGIDRMASAWLIRRFIDPSPKFKFVPAKGYRPRPLEIRFDMAEAEFTHEGDDCTFEVLLRRMALRDPALRPIAELVHDIDLKDGKFRREETPGLEHLIDGIRLAHESDDARLDRGASVFDELYAFFRKARSSA